MMPLLSVFRKLRFLLLAVLLLWVKTYVVCKTLFHIKIENSTQEFLLLFSPLSSILLFMGLALFVTAVRPLFIILLNAILTVVLWANAVFYEFFDDFLTIPVLFQKSNMGDLALSIQSLFHAHSALLFADLALLVWLWRRSRFAEPAAVSVQEKAIYFLAAALLFTVNLAIAESDRPQLLTRSFDREVLVKHIGLFHYHVYDAALQSRASAQRAFADGNKLIDIQNYTANRRVKPARQMFGSAKGKNVIVVSMESLQSFVLNRQVGGQPITPFLNEWIKQSYYFPETYQQTGQGKTSDAEFLTETSLYPLDRGAVFFTHAGNEYVATPEVLQQHGYYTAMFHANNKSFWNRDYMYASLGFNRYFHDADYAVTPQNSTGWGLKDREFFKQSITHLQSLPQPFYAEFITLTNHFPFQLPPEDRLLPEYPSQSSMLSRYMQTARYMDEALHEFVQALKESGLYEDSILVLYGDHYGISANHYQALAKYLGKDDITPYDAVQLQRVPFLIHIPGHAGKTMPVPTGQTDMKPTLLHLLGIEEDIIAFGQDKLARVEEPLIVLRDGSFVTDRYVYTANTCYDRQTGHVLEQEMCNPYSERAKTDLEYSDRLIYGDLLRFFEGNIKRSHEHKIRFHEKKL